MSQGYCFKCQEKVEMDEEEKYQKNGRKMAQGVCPECGTKVSAVLGKAD